ncbi:hypothetical protein MPTK1_8g15700 [Marchantia polymorpha subsp. ruderalis]|uniref:Uncharacterized protein n=1 Tax=Marchantia polymorpha TaxID=3197 RepID=A0A2R6WL06_MARPO|nr:hypothetical protein MARPO_0079s0043 [Marchantia polymorpha]BBN20015.1 hypothetical protein Mp_8g15700 [Marchantia polymorpha subsp. ruderalis]|eukprot:PTQ34538.1 hypothetical protein MARPO_0079s0043 [Marchantia polymorpha]
MTRFSIVLPLLMVLVLSPAISAQNNWRLFANNLTPLTLDLLLCTATGCVPKSPRSSYTIGPKGVRLLGPGDDWAKNYMVLTDKASGRKLIKNLWTGQLDANNNANILTVVQKSKTVTEVWFSDLSGKNVLLGLLQ